MKRNSLRLIEIGREQPSVLRIAANPLGSGADAKIYRITDRPELAAKIYH